VIFTEEGMWSQGLASYLVLAVFGEEKKKE